MYVGVVLKSKTRLTDKIYTYKVLEKYEKLELLGRRVIVPFGLGNKKRIGLVVESYNSINSDFKVKTFLEVIDDSPIISKEMLEIAKFMKEEYLSDFSSAIRTVLPPVDIVRINEYYVYTDSKKEGFFKEAKSKDEIIKSGISEEDFLKLIEDGIITVKYDLKTNVSRNLVTYYEFLNKDGIQNRAFTQKKIIDYIESNKIVERKKF